MAYSDANFNDTSQQPLAGFPSLGVTLGTIGTAGTATYTGTAGTTGNGFIRMPVFKAPVRFDGIRVYTTTAPASGVTGVVMSFYNGTTSFGAATLSSTVGYVDATLTADTVGSNGSATSGRYFTSTTSNEMTIQTVGIGTASGSSLGSYAVDGIFRNLFTQ